MKIWIDVLTPKQYHFFGHFFNKLKHKHKILVTSRNYNQVKNITKFGKMPLKLVGKHGGAKKSDKLKASNNRTKLLMEKIQKFSPDLVISFCSPEASRVAFGLGIKHIAFSDSPHANAVMKLSLPLVQKLMTPWIIPKKEFTKFGISEKNIIHYKAIDASIIIKRQISNNSIKISRNKKIILIRIEETEAAYASKNKNKFVIILKNIIKKCPNARIIVLSRYKWQNDFLKQNFGNRIKIIKNLVDGKSLLLQSDIFVGSGGTMTAESALLGIPTISYSAIPNIVENFLAKKKLLIKSTKPEIIAKSTVRLLNLSDIERKKIRNRAKKIQNLMEDPYSKLILTIKSTVK